MRIQHSMICMLLLALQAGAQNPVFTEQDSLRGSITPEREWWDLTYYDLHVQVDPQSRFIKGSNVIRYTVLQPHERMQIDLQPPMKLLSAKQGGEELEISSRGNAHFIHLKREQLRGNTNEIQVAFEGYPREAVKAPWDGGVSWKQDAAGEPFVATSNQGIGASIWWPNKDHMYDEVDSMAIAVTVPKGLTAVANGRLREQDSQDSLVTYHWFVSNPINNYGVNFNIANYVNFGSEYLGEKGKLDLDYYVLPYNLEAARKQFEQVPLMLEAFEHWFGPYPFYEDSFKLVEVPYLGMEHQSSITYGNQYVNGYLGHDLSGSGWGLKFDFIIIHEAGHEWFANSITYRDAADMWIHEGFTAYSESLYLDYHFGSRAAEEYVIGTRQNILNDKPVIGTYGVNRRGSGDMYFKGSNMLHTLRQLLEDDTLWRKILRGLNTEFYHQTVSSKQIEDYISKTSGKDLTAFFNQYLRTTMIPRLEYHQDGDVITYRYREVVKDFDMPVRSFSGGETHWLFPTSEWKEEKLPGGGKEFRIDPNFYVDPRPLPVHPG